MKEFMDAYKHLEKLCGEIYGGQHGITQYITDMERTYSYDSGRVSNWDEDLKTLKRLRYIRNRMVHDTADYDIDYGKEDIDFLRNFYERIMNQQDPLSLCRISKQAVYSKSSRSEVASKPREHTAIYVPQHTDISPPIKKRTSNALMIGVAIILFAIVVAVILVWMINSL